MIDKINHLKQKIKKKDQKLYDLVSSLEDDLFIQNYGALVKYLEDLESRDEDYTVEFSLYEDELEWNFTPKSDAAKMDIRINQIKANYLIPLTSNQEHLLHINEINNNSERKEIVQYLKKLVNNWSLTSDIKKSIWLYGANGTGKTHIIKAFANFIAEKGNTVSFLFVPEIIQKLKSLIKDFNGGDEIDSLLEKSKSASLLVMDDISAAAVTPWIRDTFLLPIIEYRTTNNKATIYTSNVTVKDYGRRISLANTPQEDKVASNRIVSKIVHTTEIIKI